MLLEINHLADDAAYLPVSIAVPKKPRSKTALTETFIKGLKSTGKLEKFTDDMGLYLVLLPSGGKSFRYDYRLTGIDGIAKRETLTVGRYEPGTANRTHAEIQAMDYGSVVSLADARALRDRARRQVEAGVSPSRDKAEQRAVAAEAPTFGSWVQKYFDFKADPKSGDECLADSTLELRKSVYRRLLKEPFGKMRLEDIKPMALAAQFKSIKDNNGPGPAVHARELVLLVYRFAVNNGVLMKTGLSKTSLYNLEKTGDFPMHTMLTPRVAAAVGSALASTGLGSTGPNLSPYVSITPPLRPYTASDLERGLSNVFNRHLDAIERASQPAQPATEEI